MNDEQIRQATGSALGLVNQYAGSDCSKAVISLLDMLVLDYGRALETVKPEHLQRLQAQVEQCRRLRDVLAGVPHADPRI